MGHGLNLWFVGGGEFAALVLGAFLDKNVRFSRIITRPPTRGNRLREEVSPVERVASEKNLTVFRTPSMSKDPTLINSLSESQPDAIFVIDFGEKIAEPFLSGAKFATLNVHPSLLPKYRGAAPIQRALEKGDEELGVTLFRLAEDMDAGDIYFQRAEKFPQTANTLDVMKRTAELGCELAEKFLGCVETTKNAPARMAQEHSQATLAPKITKDETRQTFDIDAQELHNRVRAFYPASCVWVNWGGKRLKLIETELPPAPFGGCPPSGRGAENPVVPCRDGSIVLKQVQPEGKKIMSGADWARGARFL